MAASKEARVPDIGDFDEVPVIEVLVSAGDTVDKDQGLITLESDKATLEVPAPFAGKVSEVKVKVGDKVSEGSVVALIEAGGEGDEGESAEKDEQPLPAGEVDARSASGEGPAADDASDAENKEGEETSKSSEATPSTQPSPPSRGGEGATVAAPTAVGDSPDKDAARSSDKQDKAASGSKSEAQADDANDAGEPRTPPVAFDADELLPDKVPYASPAVRLFARELGVDLALVHGSARGGRIVREDVQAFVKQRLASSDGGGGAGLDLLPWPKVDFGKFGPVKARELTRIQKISGANLARNWAMIPHVTQFEDADITELEALRVSLNKENEKAIAKGKASKLTMLAFLIKACVSALQKFPDFNASLDGEQLVLKQYFHIGFAADTPNGLVVPVIRDCDRKGVMQIAAETADLAGKAREGKLGPAQMQGGCFTISSLGGIGGTKFTPIINAPEVAILGVSRADTRPVWDGKAFAPRLILPLSLSYDHRVIDGASAARFAVYLANVMADMRRVLL